MSARERRFQARPAAPGLAIGPLFQLHSETTETGLPVASSTEERRKLTDALERARRQLMVLASDDDDIGADVIEYQIEMLGDPALAEQAFDAVAVGSSALTAWQDCLDAQISGFESEEDEYFKARAADLIDLRDRVSAAIAGTDGAAPTIPDGAIIAARDLTPSRFLAIDWSRLRGLVLVHGSPTSHVAILARARGVPMLTGISEDIETEAVAIIDANEGLLITDPEASILAAYRAKIAAEAKQADIVATTENSPARTADGDAVQLMVNVDHPDAIDDHQLLAADGVGLMRTEFLFIGRDRLPDEEEQYLTYRGLLDRLQGRQLVVRTLDVGGDKPLPGITLAAEENPQLGLRGLRLCLDRPDFFRAQVRALLRASVEGPLKIMLPMVSIPEELDQARQLFQTWLLELEQEGIEATLPAVGIMVETPAAAMTIDLFNADFYSIGSNDLTQYMMAASRDAGGRVGDLNDPLQPAVLRIIGSVISHAKEVGREVSLCGDMGSDPRAIGELLAMGLRRFSVAAAQLARVRRAIATFDG